MDSDSPSSLANLTSTQKASLNKGGIENTFILLLLSPSEIAKKCKITILEAQYILDAVLEEHNRVPRSLLTIHDEGDEKFTTGDALLDAALGGGIRTGMIWDIAGESAAGKTQLALQLSLTVQLPPQLGGLHGSVCYLTTTSWLQTTRLVELINTHPLLSPSLCNLSDIQTQSTSSIPKLLHVLSRVLPQLLEDRRKDPNAKTVKLVVIDTLAELFHSDKPSSKFLFDRSRNITEISTILHAFASKYQLAVVILTEVTDVFDRRFLVDEERGDLIYSEQSRWFNRADSIPGEDKKEATLGLVWANQVNARMMLSRTNRRRFLDEATIRPSKRQRIDRESDSSSSDVPSHSSIQFDNQDTVIRRLSVIFSSASMPASLDFIITPSGLSALPEEEGSSSINLPCPQAEAITALSSGLPDRGHLADHALANYVLIEDGIALDATLDEFDGLVDEDGTEDEWEAYWKQDTIPEDVYNTIDIDALEGVNTSLGF